MMKTMSVLVGRLLGTRRAVYSLTRPCTAAATLRRKEPATHRRRHLVTTSRAWSQGEDAPSEGSAAAFAAFLPKMQSLAVVRGSSNVREISEAAQACLGTVQYGDNATWAAMDAALSKDSGLSCEGMLGFAHDLLVGVGQEHPIEARSTAAAILSHINAHCAETAPTVTVSAQYSLGVIFFEGVGVEQDLKAARMLFGEASKQGHGLSLFQLAGIFLDGIGVDKQPQTAAKLLKLANDRGVAQAPASLAHLYRHGNGVPQDATLAEIYYKLGIEKGDPYAKVGLATLYNSGAEDVPQDHAEAFRLHFEAAEESGLPVAFHNLGTHYFLGKGTAQDFAAAIDAFTRGFEGGFTASAFNLGNMHMQGTGCEKDLDKAREYYQFAGAEMEAARQLVQKIDDIKAGKLSEITEGDDGVNLDGNSPLSIDGQHEK